MRMLDLFCGRLGWGREFLARGWKVTAIDIVRPDEIPTGVEFYQADVRNVAFRDGQFCVIDSDGNPRWVGTFDFGCASSPCESFSLFGMAMFHPDPPYPELGIALFNHTRALFERARIPYLMENVRPAEKFVGAAAGHCGPFHMWGKAVPPILPQGITKGMKLGGSIAFGELPIEERRKHRTQDLMLMAGHGSKKRKEWTSKVATIPPELSCCVADYVERLLEQTLTSKPELLGSGPIPSTQVAEHEGREYRTLKSYDEATK